MIGPTVIGAGGRKASGITVEIIDEITGEVTKRTVAEVLEELQVVGGPLLGRAIDGPTAALDTPIDKPGA